MKKFIKGAFELDRDVTNLEEYEEKHKETIEKIIDWANRFNVAFGMGTSDDNTYLIEYKIVDKNATCCKYLLYELRSILKSEWKKAKELWQGSGDVLW